MHSLSVVQIIDIVIRTSQVGVVDSLRPNTLYHIATRVRSRSAQAKMRFIINRNLWNFLSAPPYPLSFTMKPSTHSASLSLPLSLSLASTRSNTAKLMTSPAAVLKTGLICPFACARKVILKLKFNNTVIILILLLTKMCQCVCEGYLLFCHYFN